MENWEVIKRVLTDTAALDTQTEELQHEIAVVSELTPVCGISASNTKKRDGFKRMIADALNGKIDKFHRF